jgi:hypothetical protein
MMDEVIVNFNGKMVCTSLFQRKGKFYVKGGE